MSIPTWKAKTLKHWDVGKAIFPAWGAQREAAGHNDASSGPPQTIRAINERGSVNKQQFILWVTVYQIVRCHNTEHHNIILHLSGNSNTIQKQQ
jgi:hypothetical protein